MTEPSERAQELASRHEGLNQLALMERQAQKRVEISRSGAQCSAAMQRLYIGSADWAAAAKDLDRKAFLEDVHHRFLKGLGTDFFR